MLLAKESQVVDMQKINPNWEKWVGLLLLIGFFVVNTLFFGPIFIVALLFVVFNVALISVALYLIFKEVF